MNLTSVSTAIQRAEKSFEPLIAAPGADIAATKPGRYMRRTDLAALGLPMTTDVVNAPGITRYLQFAVPGVTPTQMRDALLASTDRNGVTSLVDAIEALRVLTKHDV